MEDEVKHECCRQCVYYKFYKPYGPYCCFNNGLLKLIPENCCIRDFCPLIPEEDSDIWKYL